MCGDAKEYDKNLCFVEFPTVEGKDRKGEKILLCERCLKRICRGLKEEKEARAIIAEWEKTTDSEATHRKTKSLKMLRRVFPDTIKDKKFYKDFERVYVNMTVAQERAIEDIILELFKPSDLKEVEK